ncbi:Rid family hydrolase [Prevotella cerevisiae]|uniref:Rid family hydrolase n=1 Tax=Segatella cerevisiae TaxID=2053716 RepID=A0ABT1C1A7_9BACT|nr:Rid family hydrolase [Segatella cerevisiae]MCO6026283.1 Rid family hydrolase [Segatella cerevisiae]
MNRYAVLSPETRGTFSHRLSGLYLRLGNYLDMEAAEGRHLTFTRIFLSDAFNQRQQLEKSLLFTEFISPKDYSIIEQAPLDRSKIALLIKTSTEASPFIFQSFRLTDAELKKTGYDSYSQALALFQKYLKSLEGSGLSMAKHLIRTWLYARDIDNNYSGLVKARNAVFKKEGLTADTHFIASTGIGGYSSDPRALVAMDFLTYPKVKADQIKYLKAPAYLNPTMDYGVAFESGTRIQLENNEQLFFISGTASIDKDGKVMYPEDITRQTARLLENIGALLADGGATMNDISYFIIYLRDDADAATTENFMRQVYPDIPHVLVHAKVCRPEWLIEMECVAEKSGRS